MSSLTSLTLTPLGHVIQQTVRVVVEVKSWQLRRFDSAAEEEEDAMK